MKLCRENQIALSDLLRKLRELSEREQYWTTGPNGRGGITESFAKRLFDFMKAEEAKFPLFSHFARFRRRRDVLSWSLK